MSSHNACSYHTQYVKSCVTSNCKFPASCLHLWYSGTVRTADSQHYHQATVNCNTSGFGHLHLHDGLNRQHFMTCAECQTIPLAKRTVSHAMLNLKVLQAAVAKIGCILFTCMAVSPYWGSSVQCTHEYAQLY